MRFIFGLLKIMATDNSNSITWSTMLSLLWHNKIEINLLCEKIHRILKQIKLNFPCRRGIFALSIITKCN
jgi:hypothetical protein